MVEIKSNSTLAKLYSTALVFIISTASNYVLRMATNHTDTSTLSRSKSPVRGDGGPRSRPLANSHDVYVLSLHISPPHFFPLTSSVVLSLPFPLRAMSNPRLLTESSNVHGPRHPWLQVLPDRDVLQLTRQARSVLPRGADDKARKAGSG